jgi:hypothetical protein
MEWRKLWAEIPPFQHSMLLTKKIAAKSSTTPIGPLDLLIAAQALSGKFVLITNFKYIWIEITEQPAALLLERS